ncbi:major royal jelly protein 2 [Aplysia californica]|uniref:Major royal jelly protein 2 n=1 Tax=Aplysia californica TaxID=6500 RepID=A0ABM0JVZ4_APLCA|nr:major royal jelly protein 2 [Aplysia californica]
MTRKGSQDIIINGERFHLDLGLSGLAMSPDFNYLYWSSTYSDELYQVPTWPLRTSNVSISDHVRFVGHKVSNTDDMIHGKDSLYFGALTLDAVYRWEKRRDMLDQHLSEKEVTMETQTQLVQNWETLQWPDSLCLDNHGNLWFTSSRAHLFLKLVLILSERV